MRTRWVVTACLLATAGCASMSASPPEAVPSSTARTPAEQVTTAAPTRLTCPTGERVSGIYDYSTYSGGSATPEEAAQEFAKGERIVIRETRAGTVGMVLRDDGTAYQQLDLVHLQDDTWRVDSYEACSGEA